MRPNGEPLPTTPTLNNAASDTESLGTAFVCSFNGCTARPFGTQALLDSHAVVHSSTRPFHCSVKDCSRSFKRKIDLTKHGWVHNSSGYSCPFCTDKKREFYRPDNLNDSARRHLSSHHPDKGKDDTTLLQVLPWRRGRVQKAVGDPSISSDVLPTQTGPFGLSVWVHRGLRSVGLDPSGFSSPVGLGLTV
ncbi:zinc finger, c2H2 type domain-containing protein [Purpureocillium lilacinum]|uniref:Zinc finger, c2H2 type domain-containing protein n=1 Tax=Purpureocillium lilacinum TaxID=33203 RepID=A0A179FFF5_PURLI|nr:zinc finger, c2H2 type domain-containing protein [Purpureocillium lilacinum]OAQ63779.1 zinc finger, c2H2 type domain-containing protein [Purpureocillium lilacinum]